MPNHFDFLAGLRAEWPALKRATRLADRVTELTFTRLADARRDDIMPAGAGSADAASCAPRQQRTAPTTRKAADDSGGDSSSDPEPERATKVKLYRVNDAMQILSVSRATLYRLVKSGDLRLVKVGAATRICAASIDALVTGATRK